MNPLKSIQLPIDFGCHSDDTRLAIFHTHTHGTLIIGGEELNRITQIVNNFAQLQIDGHTLELQNVFCKSISKTLIQVSSRKERSF